MISRKDSMEKGWVARWKASGWHRKENRDLWNDVLDLCGKHRVRFIWVKGHDENVFNNRCDELAVAASSESDVRVDEGYEEEVRRRESQMELF